RIAEIAKICPLAKHSVSYIETCRPPTALRITTCWRDGPPKFGTAPPKVPFVCRALYQTQQQTRIGHDDMTVRIVASIPVLRSLENSDVFLFLFSPPSYGP
ncbi:unnamed protein product, partial [Ectocarpus sp. 8 AP-2014]